MDEEREQLAQAIYFRQVFERAKRSTVITEKHMVEEAYRLADEILADQPTQES